MSTNDAANPNTRFPGELWDEAGYLELVRRVLEHGEPRMDRTGTGTLTLFGAELKFDLLQNRFPLLTTKAMPFRTIVHELLFFVNGCTDNGALQARGVRIWDGNSSRAYLDSIGLTDRAEGDLGPVYGFQWRHFGANYSTCKDDYTGQGVDQLARAIAQLTQEPNSRRIVVSAWNAADLAKMVLPPCHMSFQFYVSNQKYLVCRMHQRSADLGLGLPFNIASYAALTHLVAHVTGLVPCRLEISIGVADVYKNHEAKLREQLTREPRHPPKLRIGRRLADVSETNADDFVLDDYLPGARIELPMAV